MIDLPLFRQNNRNVYLLEAMRISAMETTYTAFWDKLAIQAYKSLLKGNPNSSLAHHNLGLAYLRIGRANKAIRSFLRALKGDKLFSSAYYHLSTAYNLEGRPTKALHSLGLFRKLQEQDKQQTNVLDEIISTYQKPRK